MWNACSISGFLSHTSLKNGVKKAAETQKST
jgi:hypothetical protein